jgi:hypothetical protein
MPSRRRNVSSQRLADHGNLMDELLATTSSTKYDPAESTLAAIQRKVAVSALPASALRGQRTPGLIRIARDVFSCLPLGQFGVANAKLFASRLESCTDDLLSEFPPTPSVGTLYPAFTHNGRRDFPFGREFSVCRMKTRPGYVIELGFRLGTSPPLICGVAIR